MKILVAKTAGFCMGVQRAVDVALDASNKFPPPIYTFGPLIHNPQVLRLLAEKGITVMGEIPEKGRGPSSSGPMGFRRIPAIAWKRPDSTSSTPPVRG